jgi:hypothetical protein
MNMHTGLDYAAKLMLDFCEITLKTSLNMRIDNCYHTHAFPLDIAHPFKMNYVVSYGIPDAFGTRRIAALKDYLVEFRQQILR